MIDILSYISIQENNTDTGNRYEDKKIIPMQEISTNTEKMMQF